jgi:ABC-type transporter MlaC component
VHDEMMGSFLIILLVVGGIILFVKALNWKPEKKDKKDDKTVKEEIDKLFKDLHDNAVQFKRDEVIPTLHSAKEKITNILDKKGVLDN